MGGVLHAVLTAVAVSQVAVIATSIYLHRTLAHRSISVHPIADWTFRVILWITTGQRRREWVAVHRKHHTFTDREGDPHSPRLLGFWKVQLGNVYYYIVEARKRDTLERYAPDLIDDAWERTLFRHGFFGPAIGVASLVAALGLAHGLIAAVIHAGLYVFLLAPLINALGHWRGGQNFDNNTAFNAPVLALATGGESLHNNHHAFPRSPKFSMRRGEFDPSWPVIQFLVWARLAELRVRADAQE